MGTVKLNNPHISKMSEDFLYHIGLNTGQNLEEIFGDVRFVIMGGTPTRMLAYAKYLSEIIGHKIPFEQDLKDISGHANRYSMYKVGPVITVNHGMGNPSLSILMHEMIKLMYHAKCKDPIFFRLGTSGGVGVEPGTLCISSGCVDGLLQEVYELPILGKLSKRPTVLDPQIAKDLKAIADQMKMEAVVGKTMGTLDFYEGQGRLDGAVCEYTEKDKLEYLEKVKASGIVNIEMESVPFSALTHQVGIKSGICCVALLNRLKGDQISTPHEVMEEWEDRPVKIVGQYIQNVLTGKPHGQQGTGGGCHCKRSTA